MEPMIFTISAVILYISSTGILNVWVSRGAPSSVTTWLSVLKALIHTSSCRSSASVVIPSSSAPFSIIRRRSGKTEGFSPPSALNQALIRLSAVGSKTAPSRKSLRR